MYAYDELSLSTERDRDGFVVTVARDIHKARIGELVGRMQYVPADENRKAETWIAVPYQGERFYKIPRESMKKAFFSLKAAEYYILAMAIEYFSEQAVTDGL